MKREETDIDKPIFVVTVIISVLLISKIVFWIAIGTLIFGVGWYIKTRNAHNRKVTQNALLIVGISLTIIPISYFIGYKFENIEMFNAFVDVIGTFFSSL